MERHSKRRTKMESNPQGTDQEIRNFVSLPPELLSEILLRLPFKSVARFISISTLFATIIRNKYFIRSFTLRSSKQKQRVLLAFTDIDNETGCMNWFFFSASLPPKEDSSSSSSSSSSPVFLSRFACPNIPDYVHGLLSFVYGQEHVIFNPSTGKSKTLPLVVKSRRSILRRFFGYDPVDHQYKVLCVTERMFGTGMRVASNECHQVLTLGPSSSQNKNLWRKIKCSIPHCPRSSGLCINGVLYYYAYMGTRMMERTLVRFKVRSEEFDFLTDLPEEVQFFVRTSCPHLINFEGHVAFVNHPNPFNIFHVWVLEDFQKQQWVKVTISITHWPSKLGYGPLDARGTTETGELIFATSYLVYDFFLAHHDRKMNDLTMVEIAENSEYEPGRFCGIVISFLDYVESLVFS